MFEHNDRSTADQLSIFDRGTFTAGDKVSIRDDCAVASSVADGTMDGSFDAAITISAADATGKRVCYQDLGNGFTDYVDSGLLLPVVEVTALSPGTSAAVGKMACQLLIVLCGQFSWVDTICC